MHEGFVNGVTAIIVKVVMKIKFSHKKEGCKVGNMCCT
jgi:hypothetical protein